MRAEPCQSEPAFGWQAYITSVEICHVSWEVLGKGWKIRKCEFYLPLGNFGTLKSIMCSYPLRKDESTNVHFYFLPIWYAFNNLILWIFFSLLFEIKVSPVEGFYFVFVCWCGTPDSYYAQSWTTSSRSFNTINKYFCWFFSTKQYSKHCVSSPSDRCSYR